MAKKYRSDALAAVHETALGLTEAGVMAKRTMKAFDEMCLTPDRGIDRQADPADPRARKGKPGCVCSLPQRHNWARQPVGAR